MTTPYITSISRPASQPFPPKPASAPLRKQTAFAAPPSNHPREPLAARRERIQKRVAALFHRDGSREQQRGHHERREQPDSDVRAGEFTMMQKPLRERCQHRRRQVICRVRNSGSEGRRGGTAEEQFADRSRRFFLGLRTPLVER
jgi:hypothetical protein